MNRAVRPVRRFVVACALLSSCAGTTGGGDEPVTPPSDTPAPEPGAKPAPMPMPMPMRAACTPSAGWTPLRRLTREQYANTVRDLLAGSRVSQDGLAGDETVGTFHSNLVGTATDL